tara:strand:+ start:98 stop:577 length:480 start_codon:yes stop_codon:yes gene_type:complete
VTESTPTFNLDMSPPPRRLLPVVVGAGPRSELADRPLAHGIVDAIRNSDDLPPAADLHPLIVTDLWYLNDRDLMLQPTISIGDPEQNAASAFYGGRLPTMLMVEEQYRVLMDQDAGIGHACLWGTSHAATITAVEAFIERCLPSFLQRAALRSTAAEEG